MEQASGGTVTAPEQSQGEQPAAAATKKEEQFYDIDVMGKKQKVALSELMSAYGQDKASQQRFREAAELRKQFEPLKKKIEEGDISELVDKVGKDKFRSFAEKYLLDILEEEELSPEQRKLKSLEAENSRFKKTEEERKKAEEDEVKTKKYKELLEKAENFIDNGFSEALSSLSMKPFDGLIEQMAIESESHIRTTGTILDPKTAAQRAMRTIRGNVERVLTSISPEEAIKILPDSVKEHVRKHYLEKVKSQYPVSSSSAVKADSGQKSQTKTKQTTDQFFENLGG